MDTPEGRTRDLEFNPGRGQEFPSWTMAPWSRCQGLSWTGSLGPRSGNRTIILHSSGESSEIC